MARRPIKPFRPAYAFSIADGYAEADGYADAADVIHREVNAEFERRKANARARIDPPNVARIGSDSFVGFSSAAILLESLSIEVYLKGLHMDSGGSAQDGHDLAELFDELPSEIKDSVRSEYQGQIESLPSPPEKRVSIEDLLNEAPKPFVTWRYLHEGSEKSQAFNIVLFNLLRKALKRTAARIRNPAE